MDKYSALKKYFGYTSFRNGQEEIIDNILGGSDVLAVMPTGAGKSICFQIPALLSDSTTIVISPLISLMKDQVTALKENGIAAETVNSSLDKRQLEIIYGKLKGGGCKILYVSPERLNTPEFVELLKYIDVPVVCVDEAHCVSHWGQDFRKSYLEISSFISSFKRRPTVAAFTATATDIVRDDICRLLCLKEPKITVTGFDRKNLFFEVQKPEDKFIALRDCLDSHAGKSAIVYCSTRKTVSEVCERLVTLGYNASRYHAGLTADERKNNQELFISDKVKIMVATNAFGMGIDKSDVSLVVHYNMPGDIESYYQEAGRAGRDGLDADCILLYSYKDIKVQEFFINNLPENQYMSDSQTEIFKRRKRQMLHSMVAYCTGDVCLRNTILRYFGEKTYGSCGNCSACCGVKQYMDITVSAQKVLSAVVRTKGLCDKNELTALLHGDRSVKEEYKNIKTFGTMKDLDARSIENVIDRLIENGFIKPDTVDCRTRMVNTDKAKQVLFSSMKVTMPYRRQFKENVTATEKKENLPDIVLFTSLKTLRKTVADRLSIPPLAVFPDSILRRMSAEKPLTMSDMAKISGISRKKLERYAPLFLKEINAYVKRKDEK